MPLSINPMNSAEYRHLLGKARDAQLGGEASWRVQSTGEKLAVALILNRPDWIAKMDYTLGEAIDRVGSEWLKLIPLIEKELQKD